MTPTGFIRIPYVDGDTTRETLINTAHIVSVAPGMTGSTMALSTYAIYPGYHPSGFVRTPMSYNAVLERIADAVGGWRPNSADPPPPPTDPQDDDLGPRDLTPHTSWHV